MADDKPQRLAQEQQWRTIQDKINRLRRRLKTAPIDANVRAILLGILDLLGDEL
jgi:hypothetical protein